MPHVITDCDLSLYAKLLGVECAGNDDEVMGLILSDTWNTVQGQNYVDVGNVASNEIGYKIKNTDSVVMVSRTGSVYNPVSGTPGNLQVMFDGSLLNFKSDVIFNTGETIFVIFKRPL